MILSGPKDCRGSTNDVRILLHFLHSANGFNISYVLVEKSFRDGENLTRHRRGQRIMDTHLAHLISFSEEKGFE